MWERRSALVGATTRAGVSICTTPVVRLAHSGRPPEQGWRATTADTANTHDTGGRTGAASWECWDHGVVSQAGGTRKGDQPQNWTGRCYFLILTVPSSSCILVLEVAG